MSDHFHILVSVVTGHSAQLSNAELTKRLRNFDTNPKDVLVLAELRAGLCSKDA